MADIQDKINKNLQYASNPRKIKGSELERLENDLLKFGDLGGVVYCQLNKAYVGGNQRSKVFDGSQITILKTFDKPQADKTVALGFINWNGNQYLYREVQFTEAEFKEACIVANNDGGSFDFELLAENFSKEELTDFGLDLTDLASLFADEEDLSLSSKEFEPTTSLDYLKFAGYKVQLTDVELAGLKERADNYFSEHGTLLGFAQTLLGSC